MYNKTSEITLRLLVLVCYPINVSGPYLATHLKTYQYTLKLHQNLS